MKIGAAEFKAKCLALIDSVRDRGEPVTITNGPRGGTVSRQTMKTTGLGSASVGKCAGWETRLRPPSTKPTSTL